MINNSESIRHLFEAILSLQNEEECYKFFTDLCTERELLTFSTRLSAATMLLQGHTYHDINKATGISEAIIARVKRTISEGTGGIKAILLKQNVIRENKSTNEVGANDC